MSWRAAITAAIATIVGVLILLFALVVITAATAEAKWKAEYASADQATRDWYETRELTKAAQQRFVFKSCCNNSDVVKTKFKVGGSGNDEWWWLDAGDNTWKRVPDDVIHWDEHAPGNEPVMFAIGDQPTCFFPPGGGL